MASRVRRRTEAPQAATASNGPVTKRLQGELMQLMMSGSKDLTAFPDGDNLFKWIGTIKGVADTPYEGLTFRLSFEFPQNYPHKPPLVKFETPVFHPNVDQAGLICLDILKDKWSPVYNVSSVLLSLQSLLGEPNNESPLNQQAAALWDNQLEFKKMVLRRAGEAGSDRRSPGKN